MRSKFEKLSKPEVDFLIDNCNFSDEERIILSMASAGNSEVQIAGKTNISTSSVTKKKKAVLEKIYNLIEVIDKMTVIYVDGKRVTKDELKKYEINIEEVKKILAEKLTKTK